jgi:hypothetical protein
MLAVSPTFAIGVQSGVEWIHFEDGFELDNMVTVPVGFAISLNLSPAVVASMAFAFDHAAIAGGMEPPDTEVGSQWSSAVSLMAIIR